MPLDRIVLKAHLPLLLSLVFAATPAAHAALVLGSETINLGSGNVSTGANTVNVVSSPGTAIYGNALPGGLTNLLPPPDSVAGYNFYDDFIINIPTAGVNSVSSTINLGSLLSMSVLQVRLYAGDAPTLSPPSVIDGWSTPISAGGDNGIVSVLPLTTLSAGDYVLEIRGLADGSAGGSYSGALNVAAVPLPPSILLLAPALGGFGLIRHRKARGWIATVHRATA